MRTIERRIEYSGRGTWFTFYNLTDIHGGSVHCAEKKFDKIIAEIAADPCAYWGLGGDWCEFISKDDPRYKASEVAPWALVDSKGRGIDDIAEAQEQWIFGKLAPIADKNLWINGGNHEETIRRHTNRSAYKNMVEFIKEKSGHNDELGLGYRGFVRVRFHRPGHTNTLTIFAEHGAGGGQLRGGIVNKVERYFGYYPAADLIFTGHVHKCDVFPHSCQTPAGKVVKFGAICGTFYDDDPPKKQDEMDTGNYADGKGYNPTDVMGVKIKYNPDTKEMKGTVFAY